MIGWGLLEPVIHPLRARQESPTARVVMDVELTATIRQIHATSRGTYGVSRVTRELRLSLRRAERREYVARLMNAAARQGFT